MDTIEAIRSRRSVKQFTGRTPSREQIEALLELAVLAPNHRMTEPWGFLVLGPAARRACGEAKGAERAGRVDDPEVAEAIREKMAADLEGIPAMLAFTQRLHPDPEVREEDYASVWMGIQNVLLGAVAMGLGTHVKTGSFLGEPAVRAALGVHDEEERIVALVHLGEPAEIPAGKPRTPASERTRTLP